MGHQARRTGVEEMSNTEEKVIEDKNTLCIFNTSNIYHLQDQFADKAKSIMIEFNIDKETFAYLCLDWVWQNAKWDNHSNTTNKKPELVPEKVNPEFQPTTLDF